ncbi:MAG: hypothetical protein ACREAM_23925, partial [Blastocatellia bacterium]
EEQTPIQGRIREDFTPDAHLAVERDELTENEPQAILTQADNSMRPKLGTFARPRTVYGSRLPGCPYDCAGALLSHDHGLFECETCRTWWTLRPPDANLAAELAGDPGAVEDPQVTRPTSAATPPPSIRKDVARSPPGAEFHHPIHGAGEMETIRRFKAPTNCRKLVHVWRDRQPEPEVKEIG